MCPLVTTALIFSIVGTPHISYAAYQQWRNHTLRQTRRTHLTPCANLLISYKSLLPLVPHQIPAAYFNVTTYIVHTIQSLCTPLLSIEALFSFGHQAGISEVTLWNLISQESQLTKKMDSTSLVKKIGTALLQDLHQLPYY